MHDACTSVLRLLIVWGRKCPVLIAFAASLVLHWLYLYVCAAVNSAPDRLCLLFKSSGRRWESLCRPQRRPRGSLLCLSAHLSCCCMHQPSATALHQLCFCSAPADVHQVCKPSAVCLLFCVASVTCAPCEDLPALVCPAGLWPPLQHPGWAFVGGSGRL